VLGTEGAVLETLDRCPMAGSSSSPANS
jgi:hypothetical protein